MTFCIKLVKTYELGIKSFLAVVSVFCILNFTLFTPGAAYAVTDPLSVPNNKFGIHILSATPDEINPAQDLVNSSGGDWGYLTILIGSKDRNHNKWQAFFNDLRKRHLIPIVRLATEPKENYWKRPYEGEEIAWADFLGALTWPTKNRYVIIYNEPNHSKEWENKADSADYAKVLDKTITALKSKSDDFFVLNAGLDASAPHQPPNYYDEVRFLTEMNKSVPGILDKLDGFVSHSYPNPGFLGSPNGVGRGSVRTWIWEQQILTSLGVKKKLPVFITETGWKHSEGQIYDKSYPSPETIGDYFVEAFKSAWNSGQIVAVTPFLLNYQAPPFDHFSFKKYTGEPPAVKILGASYPDYHPHYQIVTEINKPSGKPIQVNKGQLTSGGIYSSLVGGELYNIIFKFKNTGESIWGDQESITLVQTKGQTSLKFDPIKLPVGAKIEPDQVGEFEVKFKAPSGDDKFTIGFNLYSGSNPFDQGEILFSTTIKNPVALVIKVDPEILGKNPTDFTMMSQGAIGKSFIPINFDSSGTSKEIVAKYLLPDYPFDFTLSKPFYRPKTINTTVKSGTTLLDFGKLEVDLWAIITDPINYLQTR